MNQSTGWSGFTSRPELRPYIKGFYRAEGYSGAKDVHSMVGGPGLSVDLWWFEGPALTATQAGGRARRHTGAVIGGTLTRMLSVTRSRGTTGFGVSLAPMAASALLGVDAEALRDNFVDLDDALDRAVPHLSEMVFSARTAVAKAQTVENELLKLLHKRQDVDDRVARVVGRLAQSVEGATVEGLAEEIGYTRRRLSDLVRRALGVSPKELIRIVRFRRALMLMESWSGPDWLSVVAECGYVDQSHFIRHCREFTGLPPGEFLSQGLFPPLDPRPQ
ncbi:MAG: helix-turn-helix domain-containing protein [Elusimicrobiota bacterium]